jgi:predicted Zn-dependent peptidase
VFYCGSASLDRVEKAVKAALRGLPEIEPDFDLGTDVRMNTVEENVRYFEDRLNVTQGKLAIGFRLGDCMEEPDYGALLVFNAIYGGSVNSKLFMNVREKLSLCYFASSSIERHKGIMLVSSGIEFQNYQKALDEIMAQLDAVRNGDFTDSELFDAKKYVVNNLRTIMDSQGRIEDFYLGQLIEGLDESPEELAERVSQVTADEVKTIASGVAADAIYFLRGEDEQVGA